MDKSSQIQNNIIESSGDGYSCSIANIKLKLLQDQYKNVLNRFMAFNLKRGWDNDLMVPYW